MKSSVKSSAKKHSIVFASFAVCVLGVSVLTSSFAQTSVAKESNSCILGGRINSDDFLAHRANGIDLLDAQGKALTKIGKGSVDDIKQVRISKPALLSICNGTNPIQSIDPQAGQTKPISPIVTAGNSLIAVEKVALLGLKSGGSLVELQLALAPDRVGTK